MLSFVVPALNEEAYVTRTVQAIQESSRALGEEFELIVVDDASTDKRPRLRENAGRLSSM